MAVLSEEKSEKSLFFFSVKHDTIETEFSRMTARRKQYAGS